MSAQDLPDDTGGGRYWPTFKPEQGLGSLARFVAPRALDTFLTLGERPGGPAEEADVAIAGELYAMLVAQHLRFREEPWEPRRGQRIRHLAWIRSDGGNCLDLTLLYAAMCLEMKVAPILVLTESHAFAAIRPGLLTSGARWEEGAFSLDGGRHLEAGVLTITDSGAAEDAIAAGAILPVDCVAATRGESFEAACASSRKHLGKTLRLIDVCYLQSPAGEQTPLLPPRGWPTVGRYQPGEPSPRDLFSSQRTIADRIEKRRAATDGARLLVIHADPGQGKSTIGRYAVDHAPNWAGWFLAAADREALVDSLAAAEAAERGEYVTLERPEREAYAYSALERLQSTTSPWLVVLDNADVEPGALAPFIPPAGPGQLVLVTTNRDTWRGFHGSEVLELGEIPDAQVTDALGTDELHDVIRGRALLVTAFTKLMRLQGVTARGVITIAAKTTELDPALRGPVTWWRALQGAPGFEDHHLRVSALMSYLPPEGFPVAMLEQLADAPPGTAEWLAERGLFDIHPLHDEATLHRLFGRSVRAELERQAGAEHALEEWAAIRITTSADSLAILERRGELEGAVRLLELLEHTDDHTAEPNHALALGFSGIGRALEIRGGTAYSVGAYDRAERHLGTSNDDRRIYADCLHARARAANRDHAGDERRLREGLDHAREARELIEELDGKERAGRYLAMEGLLLKQIASFPRAGETTLGLLEESLRILEEAHEMRRLLLAPDDPELARSRFNLAGVRIPMAQADPPRAETHLDIAEAIYLEVAARREASFGVKIHPQIAPCLQGLGLVAYYRALVRGHGAAERSSYLREASARTIEALAQWEHIEAPGDGAESAKSARALAKISLARHARAAAEETLGDWPRARSVALGAFVEPVAREAVREMAQGDPPAAFASRQAPGDIRAWIESWVTDPALIDLVERFGGKAPDGELRERLSHLGEFSTVWDYRNGRERNLVEARLDDPELEGHVLRAAAALGLRGTNPPAYRDYDAVIILGGLVRACLARPGHAARLVEQRAITTRRVIALGGYRPLRGDEVEMARTMIGAEIGDELHAMDAGVRDAFGLAAPVQSEGGVSETVGAGWAHLEYRSANGLPVNVVAAPSSEPGVRRANTPDTYRWLVSDSGLLHENDAVLVVTTDIYRPFQGADALRMLRLPLNVHVDIVGITAGEVDHRLAQRFEPHSYLQELRSTILALGSLKSALDRGSTPASRESRAP